MTCVVDNPAAEVAAQLADVSGANPATGAYRYYVQDHLRSTRRLRDGALTRTYVGHTLAHVDGGNPATGAYLYYLHDHLGSTRRLRDGAKSSVGFYAYTPYGDVYAESGASLTRKYALLDWDPTAQLHYAPFRYYSPALSRWLTRDPLGMADGPHRYGYVGCNPVAGMDPEGTLSVPWPSIPIYGKWCGPGWSAGRKPTKDDPVTKDEWKGKNTKDKMDACCKAHDACYGGIDANTGEELPKDKRTAKKGCDKKLCECIKPIDLTDEICTQDAGRTIYTKNAIESVFGCNRAPEDGKKSPKK